MSRIMVIDDEPDLLMLYEASLEDAGHTVQTLSEGANVISEARGFRPQLILLDWVLPDISGDEILRRLKAEHDVSGIPVVVITALDGLESHARLLGAADVRHKPLHVRDLTATIDRLLT